MRQGDVIRPVHPLEMQLEQPFVERIADALAPRQAVAHFGVGFDVRAEHAPGVLAGVLGLIHGDVGARNQLVGVDCMGRIVGNAQAGGDAQALPLEAERNLRDRAHHAISQRLGFVVLHGREQNGEFVAAQPRQHFVAPHQGADLAGHPDQQGIARAMAVAVVDGLEFVEVEEHHRASGLLAIGFEHGARQFLLETVPVVEPGQRIALGQIHQLVGGLALAGDVFVNPQMADEAAFAVTHRVVEFGDDAAVGHLDFEAVRQLVRFQHRQQMSWRNDRGAPGSRRNGRARRAPAGR